MMLPMGGMSSRITLGLVTVLAVAGLCAGTASAGTTISASEEGLTFEPGPYVQGLGEVATFDNTKSSAPHDVTSNQVGPDNRPLFFSDVILGGTSTEVRGTQYLTAGTYPFFCNIHGAAMSGELTVDGSQGAVVPRPAVRVVVVNQRLRQVRRVGVRVRIRAVTASSSVTLTATRGKAVLGVRRGLNFRAGQTRTLVIPLTARGRKALRRARVLPVRVRAAVPFGRPVAANRRVR